ncbi:MAG: hypothetical protein A2086_08445 [Spirochaetes bacterium GWD1_27_9]|nr:MAG: hypothetical protein A2Z98_00220 [Spirochaetes bacterium GWB1_27_13]OHD20830.1 MAG: hypothetical protein A2Y34_12720 [Spirochaetes bacterium GWC1_27_15]OHD30611.1 MAG: hypothetical protein A2086_08445 [Spirochaetes bacterium GWD1_27_9]
MNIKSLLISGLVTGLVIMTSALTMVPVVGNQMDAVLASRGLPPLSNIAMIFFCFVSLITGIILIWLYAVLKNYYGAGIKTVIIVSVFVWFIGNFLSSMALIAYGFMPVKLTVIGTIWGFFETLIASIIGTRFYKDKK